MLRKPVMIRLTPEERASLGNGVIAFSFRPTGGTIDIHAHLADRTEWYGSRLIVQIPNRIWDEALRQLSGITGQLMKGARDEK